MKRLFFILFLATASLLIALDPNKAVTHYNVQVWDMDSGLPGNSVFALRQTSDGYLWIGTQDGLVRFDGIHFEVYTRETVPQLKSNDVRALCEDRNGTLWIGTSTGGLTRCRDGEFTTYPAAENNALSRIRAIEEDRRGNLWIGSHTGGLTCFNNDRFTTYTTKQGLPDNQVRFIYKDENQDLWVTTSAGIVKVLKPGIFQNHAPHDVLPCLKTAGLYEADTGNLWIGTGEGGLFRLKNGIAAACGTGAEIPSPTINTLYKDRQDNLWIGTDGGGLTRLKGDPGLACGSVYAVTEDREGSLWVGTLDRGLYQLRDSKFTTYTTGDGLSHDIAYCIYESRDKVLWIGTEGGLDRLKDGKPVTVLTTGEGPLNNSVSCLSEDSAGYLWIGTWGGLHRFRDGKLTTLTDRNGLSDNRVKCILQDKQGYTWIGTENGLNRFDNINGKFAVFTTRRGLTGNTIEFIYEDSRGELWIGTNAGLNRLSGGIITAYRLSAGAADYSLKCAYEDKEGTLWLGTDRGLILAQEKESDPQSKNLRGRLTETEVCSILEDDRGYLWLAGRKGILRVDKKALADFAFGKTRRLYTETYNEKDGMKSRWCIGPGCKTRDGRFWFPTSVGVAMIDPGRIEKNTLAPSPIIEKLIVDGETVPIKSFCGGSGGSFFKKRPLAAGGILELAPGKKRLEFYYTAASFTNPQKMKFKLKLEDYDHDWVDMGNVRSTTYTGLSPGQYTFKVIACNADGVWNREGASFSFYLRPYFYKTSWFYFLVVLFVLLAVFSLHRFRIRQLRARERELRLKEMDEIKSRFFANISHEFRTPLTLIMGPLEERLAHCRDKKEERELKMMLRNSRRLLSLINQLLDLSKLDSGKMKLQVSRQNIVPFLKGIVNSFDSLVVQNGLELTFRTDEQDIAVYFDAEKIEKAVCNLLINAVKFTPAGGKITVGLKLTKVPLSGFLEISVRDTGIGISVEELEHIFDRFYQAEGLAEHGHKGSGIGLALAKEVVTLHHGEIFVHSEKGKGSEFIIHLPLGDSHLKPGEIAEQPVKPHEPKAPRDIPGIFPAVEEEDEDVSETLEIPGPVQKDIILIVEDNADVRAYIRGPLQSLYRVEEAKDGEEGIKKAQEIIPDLIISDIMMPGIDGYELCRVLKNDIKTSHIPLILLTAKASEESIIEGLETGADDYITKPFNTKILIARIKNLIDLRRQLQENLKREMTFQPARTSISKIDREFLKDLQAVLDENISEPEFNVDQLSKKLYMGHTTLYRKIHALSGESPTEFIRSYRLKRGAELLKKGMGSVLEVAFEVGFSSANYFTRCFKKKFHQLPTEYQASEME